MEDNLNIKEEIKIKKIETEEDFNNYINKIKAKTLEILDEHLKK